MNSTRRTVATTALSAFLFAALAAAPARAQDLIEGAPASEQVIADKAVEIAARDGHAVERVLVYENADAAPKASTPS